MRCSNTFGASFSSKFLQWYGVGCTLCAKGGLAAFERYLGANKKSPGNRGSGVPKNNGRDLFLRVPIGIHRRKALPLLGQILEGENRGDRTNWNAGPAVNAFDRIDIQH